MGMLSGLGSLFEGSKQGEYYQPLENKGTTAMQEMLSGARSTKVAEAGEKLHKGASLKDALAGLSIDEQAGLATNPVFGQLMAQQQVLNNPLMSGLFGKGGTREGALSEEARLRDQGFSLQKEDHEAYGQASGNIARLFGAQEQDLTRSLASRGLAAAPNGASAVQFSGLQGNKNEQLAQSQMQIANQRMQNTQSRLADTRNYLNTLNNTAMDAQGQAFGNNLSGDSHSLNRASTLAQQMTSEEGLRQASLASKLANQSRNLGDAFAAGMYKDASGGFTGLLSSYTGGGDKGGSSNKNHGETEAQGGTGTGSADSKSAGAWSGRSVGNSGGSSGGSSGGMGGKMPMFSDRNLKQDIEQVFDVPVFSYNYINPEHGSPKHVSVMAQDLPEYAVIKTDEGLMVDYARLVPQMFAQIALLTAEVKELRKVAR